MNHVRRGRLEKPSAPSFHASNAHSSGAEDSCSASLSVAVSPVTSFPSSHLMHKPCGGKKKQLNIEKILKQGLENIINVLIGIYVSKLGMNGLLGLILVYLNNKLLVCEVFKLNSDNLWRIYSN